MYLDMFMYMLCVYSTRNLKTNNLILNVDLSFKIFEEPVVFSQVLDKNWISGEHSETAWGRSTNKSNLLHDYVYIWIILKSIIKLYNILMPCKLFQYLDLSFNILNSYRENHLHQIEELIKEHTTIYLNKAGQRYLELLANFRVWLIEFKLHILVYCFRPITCIWNKDFI